MTFPTVATLDLSASTPRLFAAGHRADLSAHTLTFGTLPHPNPHTLLEHILKSNLDGRGGAGFSTYRKLISSDRGHTATVLANAAEGEYLSFKDRMLLEHAPHLVLDGLAIAGQLLGTNNLVLYARAESLAPLNKLATTRGVRLLTAPGTFIAGEASAAVSTLRGGPSLPTNHTNHLNQTPTRTPLLTPHRSRHHGPVLVHNAETLAHLALIARDGSTPYTTTHPETNEQIIGTRLLTVHNRTKATATVLEVPDHTSLNTALSLANITPNHLGTAILVGGFQGRWATPTSPGNYPQHIGSPQLPAAAGIIYPLTPDECPINHTAHITSYLADQSAHQCGPCTNGLPTLAEALGHLTSTTSTPVSESQLRPHIKQLMNLLTGRGVCKHPDATVRFVAAALGTFQEELTLHAHGACTAYVTADPLPVFA